MLPAFCEKCSEKNFVNYTPSLHCYIQCKIITVKIVIVIRADGNEKEIVTTLEIKEGTNLYVPLPLDFEL